MSHTKNSLSSLSSDIQFTVAGDFTVYLQKVVNGLIADEGKLDAGVDPEFLESAFSAYLSLCIILNDVVSI